MKIRLFVAGDPYVSSLLQFLTVHGFTVSLVGSVTLVFDHFYVLYYSIVVISASPHLRYMINQDGKIYTNIRHVNAQLVQ